MGASFTAANFPDFFEATGAAQLPKPGDLQNDAVLHTYWFWRMMVGKEKSRILQGGSSIRGDIMLDHPNTFGPYTPTDQVSPTTTNVLRRWEIPWRFYNDFQSWFDHEVLLNSGSGMTDAAVFQQFVDFRNKLNQQTVTGTFRGLENALLAVPDPNTMEGLSVTSSNPAMYSLFAYANLHPNTLFQNPNVTSGSFTKVAGLDCTQAGLLKWRNQMVGYEHGGITVPTALVDGLTAGSLSHERTIVEGLDDAIEEAKFEPPRGPNGEGRYFESGALTDNVILTTRKGKNEVKHLYRKKQDAFVKPNDPYTDVEYGGYPILRIELLESAAVYAATVTGTTVNTLTYEGSSALDAALNMATAWKMGTGPVFHVLNLKHLSPVFHSERYFYRHPVGTPWNQPWAHTAITDFYTNLFCDSRMRQVVLAPGKVTGNFQLGTQTYYGKTVYPAWA
jgi:hypothetical protein